MLVVLCAWCQYPSMYKYECVEIALFGRRSQYPSMFQHECVEIAPFGRRSNLDTLVLEHRRIQRR